MKKRNEVQVQILRYKFNDSKAQLRAVILGNLLPVFIFLIANNGNLLSSPFAQLSLLSFLVVWVMNKGYDFENSYFNIGFIIVYLGIYIYELYFFGIPNPMFDGSDLHNSGKGILFVMMINSIPSVYSMMRLLLVVPLINIYLASVHLNKVKTF